MWKNCISLLLLLHLLLWPKLLLDMSHHAWPGAGEYLVYFRQSFYMIDTNSKLGRLSNGTSCDDLE